MESFQSTRWFLRSSFKVLDILLGVQRLGHTQTWSSEALKREAMSQQEKIHFKEKSIVRHTQDGKGLEEVSTSRKLFQSAVGTLSWGVTGG